MKSKNLIRQIKTIFLKRYGHINFHLMDYTIFCYVLLIGFLVIPFHRNVKLWGIYPFAHLFLFFLLMEFLRLAANNSSKFLQFFRTLYPAIGVIFAWIELNNLITMIFPYWANDFIVNLDKMIFSVHPTVWIEKIFTPWLNELMYIFYASYYLLIPVSTLPLYFSKRKRETLDFMFLLCFTYSISFLLFLLFPAEGPWVILKDLHSTEPEGLFFYKLEKYLQNRSTIRGAAFPSSHVSAAFTILLANFKFQWKLGIVLSIFVIGLIISTVYLQYHHAVDAIAGIVLSTILYFIGILLLQKWYNKHNTKNNLTIHK